MPHIISLSATFTMRDPSSCTDSHATITTAHKAMKTPPYCPYRLENANVRAKGMTPMSPKASKPWEKMVSPSFTHKSSKWGVCASSLGVQFNEPEVPCFTCICPKKGLGRVYTNLLTVVIFYYSGSFSFSFFSYLWFYNFIQWTGFVFVARPKNAIF